MDYFEAYRKRMERYDNMFNGLVIILKAKGLKAQTSKEQYSHIKLSSYICVETDKDKFCVGFDEVPYRFYIDKSIDPKLGKGSSRRIMEINGTDFPWTADDLIEIFQEV